MQDCHPGGKKKAAPFRERPVPPDASGGFKLNFDINDSRRYQLWMNMAETVFQ